MPGRQPADRDRAPGGRSRSEARAEAHLRPGSGCRGGPGKVSLAGLVLALVGVAPAADTPHEAATAAVFAGLVRADEPGFAVLVRRDGKTVFERGYGVRE